MILLSHGEKTPAVGIVQRLINVCRKKDSRFSDVLELKEDAIFGVNTRKAVKKAQGALGIKDDGAVGPDTWNALSAIAKFRIVHVVDRAIEHMLKTLGHDAILRKAMEQYRKNNPGKSEQQAKAHANFILSKCKGEVQLFKIIANSYLMYCKGSPGSGLIEITSMLNPLSEIRRGLANLSRDDWKVVILRIVAHGGPGRQAIACSPFGSYTINTDILTFDDDDTPSELVETVILEGMTMSMASFGCIELHGCSIAKKKKSPKPGAPPYLTGAAYIQALAHATSRPATAAMTRQQGDGGLRRTVCFEGATVTGYPGGSSAEHWFKNNP